MVVEKTAPLVCDEQSVGLQRVLDLLVAAVFLLQSHSLAKKVKSSQKRLATMPTESDYGHLDGLDILPDVKLQ